MYDSRSSRSITGIPLEAYYLAILPPFISIPYSITPFSALPFPLSHSSPSSISFHPHHVRTTRKPLGQPDQTAGLVCPLLIAAPCTLRLVVSSIANYLSLVIITCIACRVSCCLLQTLFVHSLCRLVAPGEIHTILSAESGYETRMNNRGSMRCHYLLYTYRYDEAVENELEVFKRACFTAENEKRALTEEVASLRQKTEALESQKSVRAYALTKSYLLLSLRLVVV